MSKSLVRTSISDPILVAWLPVATPGKLGLTIAPGKNATSLEGAPWKRDLDADLERLVAHHGVSVLVCLLEDHEFTKLGIPRYLERAKALSIDVLRLAIPDGGIPSTRESVVELVKRIRAACSDGKNVVIHCAAGLGRSGVIGGAVLIAEGQSAAEAIATLHRVRSPRSPENRRQEQFLATLTDMLQQEAAAPKPRSASPSRESRVVGCVLGAAVGDAMGHPTEFMKLPAIRQRWGSDGVQGFELYWERGGKRFAPYTDDTQMAEIVLRTLVESRDANEEVDASMQRMAKGFVDWATHPQGGHRAPGNACLAGCRALAQGVHWSLAGGASAGGCGSVMRAYPFGLVFADDLQRAEHWAVEHSKLTHRDPIALASCAAMAVGTARAFNGEPPANVLDAMVAAAERYSEPTAAMIRRAIDDARTNVAPDVTLVRLQAWAAHEAIAAAAYIFARHPDDIRTAILEGANTDGDSDSIATLAGALVGARCGVESLPKEWVRDIERGEELTELAQAVTRRG